MAKPTLPQRLHAAINRHDLEALVDCFAPDYQSEQPVHPARAFTGAEQVRKNWAALFAGLPDLRADLIRSVADGDTVWMEWEWTGTGADGSRTWLRGVTLLGVDGDRIRWGRLYMEPVEEEGPGIDATIERMARPR